MLIGMGQKACQGPFGQCHGCGSCVPPGSFFGCLLFSSRCIAPIPQSDSFRRTLCSVQWGVWLDGRPILLADLQAWPSMVSRRTQCLNSPRSKSILHSRADLGRHLGVLVQWEFLNSLPAFTALQMFATIGILTSLF